ncbi:MAG: efflux RND transporter permease subunit [Acidobacteria bacterium]|nr:efflux RND transporter permease subunit [Acidobacteriota bacterium]
MIAHIIRWCAGNRFLVLLGAAVLTFGGVWTMLRSPIDAIPDISDVQVIIVTEWPGRSPDLIEDQVTYPIVSALVSAPRVRTVRGFTDFGISYVYVIFEDRTDIYWARTRVTEYLQGIRQQLPDNVSPSLGPDATGVGWVFTYALVDETGQHDLAQLRSLQDWHLRYWLASVPGVAEVASIGGFVKQYQVTLDPNRLYAYGLSAMDVVGAIRMSNDEVEGRLLEFSGREYMVRGRGYLTSLGDIEQVAVGVSAGGTPIRVADVASVRIGPDIRRGIAELDGRGEVVGGIVVMRFGENALDVIDRVKARIEEIRPSLPTGVDIVTTYDRSGLIRDSIRTLRTTLIEETVIVSLVTLLFLFHIRSALIPIITLPIAVVATFIPVYYLGITSNIMSLGGIALAIAVLVDATLVMVENAHRRLTEPAPDGTPPPEDPAGRTRVIVEAATQVGRPLFFSLLIIIVSFTPVFLLEAQEGRMFLPLALTKTFSMIAATLLSITLAPVLMILFLRRGRMVAESRNPAAIVSTAVYRFFLSGALRWKWTTLAVNFAIIPLMFPLMLRIGSEFMPPLYEGALLYMPTAPPGLSATEAGRMLQIQDRIIKEMPEVELVLGTAGRGTTATDNSPMGMINTTVLLKPREMWRPGMTFQGLQAELDAQLQIPGFPNTWTQPIRNRLDMLSTGIKTPVGIKVLGPDLEVIERIGLDIEQTLQRVEGTRSVYAERVAQGYFTDIVPDREALARYGLTTMDVQETIQIAIGGETVTRTVEGRERYPVNVRYARDFRSELPALGRVLVKTAAGAQIPLSSVAEIQTRTGPAMIRDEDGQLAGYIYVDSDTTDIGGYVARAQAAIADGVAVPPGYRLDWTGQYEFQLRARERLKTVIPIVLGVILLLLYMTFRSFSESIIVMLSVVYAMTGGLLLQWWLGYNFSVAVWVGYIALYGIAVQTGVVMVVYLHEALDARLRSLGSAVSEQDVWDATIAGSIQRLRPKLMTVTTTIVGLLPIMWSTGVGADLMKPIAAPIVGGMVTSTIHVLIVTPVIFYLMKRHALRRGTLRVSEMRSDSA